MRTVVVIPVYEPEACFENLVYETWRRGHTVLVVNDGSSAEYKELFDRLSIWATILHHEQNRGKGAAIKTALTYVQEYLKGFDVIGVMDGDGQHTPEDMECVLKAAGEKRGGLALGVRSVGRKMPFRSRFGNRLTKEIFHIISGSYLSDTQSGLRAFAAERIPEFVDIPGDRYETNELLYCVREGIPVEEVPIQTIYKDKENSASHFRVVRDSLLIYGEFFKFAASSLTSFVIDYLVFALLVWLFPDGYLEILAANLAARAVSASFNYCVNARLVFKQPQSPSSGLRYLALAVGIFFCNSLFLSFYKEFVGLPPMTAKLVTEVSLFLISFLVQKRLIYRKTKKKKPVHFPLFTLVIAVLTKAFRAN